VTTDSDDNQIWSYYKGAMGVVQPINDREKSCQLVVISPNEPKAVNKYVDQCIKNNWQYMYDPAFQIPDISVVALRRGVKNARIVIGNDYEIALLKQRAAVGETPGQIWITTLGSKGSMIEYEGNKMKVKAAKPQNTSDPTGAGDAFRAGFVAGLVKGLDLKVCGQMGSVCSVYTVEKYGTQTHKFSLSEFKKRYRENYKKDLIY